MNKRETNMKTIAGVKVTNKAATQIRIVNAFIVIAINAFVHANGGWTQAFQGGVQNDGAQVTYTK